MPPHLSQIVEQAKAAETFANDFRLLNRVPVRLGVMSTIGPMRLAALMAAIERQSPGVETAVREGRRKRWRRNSMPTNWIWRSSIRSTASAIIIAPSRCTASAMWCCCRRQSVARARRGGAARPFRTTLCRPAGLRDAGNGHGGCATTWGCSFTPASARSARIGCRRW